MGIHCPTLNTWPSGTTALCLRQAIKIFFRRNIIITIMLANIFDSAGNRAKFG